MYSKNSFNSNNNIFKLLNKNNKTFKNLKLPKSEEISSFRFHFYKKLILNKNNIIKNNNITKLEQKAIINFNKIKPFTVLDCDKNIGLAIINTKTYNKIVRDYLNNNEYFKEIKQNPLNGLIYIIKNKIKNLLDNKLITKSLANKLIPKNPRLSRIRLLPKLHKESLDFRPIINSINSPTSNISLVIDYVLQPFVKNTKSYIIDSQNLMQDLETKKFPIDSNIHSLDYLSLYTNIDQNQALNTISDYIFTNEKDLIEINALVFRELLYLNLFFNYFTFENENIYYIQIKGVAMGSKSGPTIANLFLSILEEKFLNTFKPFYYKRFIDDILTITNKNFKIDNLLNFFNEFNLKLNISSSNTNNNENYVQFLDLNIKLSITGHIIFEPFFKKTNSFAYLLTNSNHPKSIFNNIPKGLLINLRRRCSIDYIYYFYARKLAKELINRSYNENKIMKLILVIGNIDRNKLLPYKEKINNEFNNKNTLFFDMPYDMNINLNNNIYQSFKFMIKNSNNNNNIKNKKAIFNNKFKNNIENLNFKYINSMQSNIERIFVHNFAFNKNNGSNTGRYIKCKDFRCYICKFANTNNHINLNNKFILPIKSFSSCNSINAVYIINCKRCNFYYIGETIDIKSRIKRHLIDSITNKTTSNSSATMSHFNKKPHNILKDFNFYIFKTKLEKNLRKNTESILINLFIKLKLNLINVFIPNETDQYYLNPIF